MTTSILRPNSTIYGGSISTVGGAGSQHATLADNSDATYLWNGGVPWPTEWVKYGLTTVTLPADVVVKSVRPRIRKSGIVSVSVSLRTGDGVELNGFTVAGGGPGSFTEVSAAAAKAAGWTQTTVDTLQWWVRRVGPYELDLFWAEAYVDLVYVSVPTLTVTAPSGTVTTASPTVTVTFTGDADADDGGLLARLHVKVFTAAQYGAGGFDPATSTAEWDSGVLDTDSPNVVVGPLDDNTTYKAYARGAHLVNGVPQWSAWDDGSAFLADTSSPVVDTITVDTTSSWDAGKLIINVARDTGESDWTHVNVERAIGMIADPSVVDPDTYETVRGALQLAAPNDTIEVPDYEQPEGVWIYYRARGLIVSDGVVLSQGDWTDAAPLLWNSDFEWLRSKDDPTNALAVYTVMQADHTESTEHRVALFDVDQREDPVPIWGAPALPAGVLPLQTYTDLAAAALDDLLRTPGELLFQGRATFGHRRKWLVVTSHSKARFESLSPVRSYELTYIEIDAPPVLS